MSDEILINVGVGETRIALVDEGVLRDLVIERSVDDSAHGPCSAGTTGASLVGNLMIGRVERVLPGMQAAFVDAPTPSSPHRCPRGSTTLQRYATPLYPSPPVSNLQVGSGWGVWATGELTEEAM